MKKIVLLLCFIMILMCNITFASHNVRVGSLGNRAIFLDTIHYTLLENSQDYEFYLIVSSDPHTDAYSLHIRTNREASEYTIMEALVFMKNGTLFQEQIWDTKSYGEKSIVDKSIQILDEYERGVDNGDKT